MFIGYYELENNEPYFNIYHKSMYGYKQWHEDTFSGVYNIEILDFKISGETYKEKKESLKDLAINWQDNFSPLSWNYSELAKIGNYFYKNGKRYGLLKEFKENGIC